MSAAKQAASATEDHPQGDPALFTATQWTVVQAAGESDLTAKAAALEHLCRRYWQPVYLFVRRRGADPHEAEDLTQSFFARLLEKDALRHADRQKGKFRTFLLASVTNFLANEWDKRQTLKRGGGLVMIALDDTAVEETYLEHQNHSLPPDKLFDRRWAQSVIEQTRASLKKEYAAAGKAEMFETLEPGLTGAVTASTTEQWAARLGLTEAAVKVALHRLRRRFGEVLRREIAHTVSKPDEISEEIRYLFSVLSQ